MSVEIPQQTEDLYPGRRRAVRAIPKYREAVDYDALPDWALIGIAEVTMLTRCGKTKIERLIESGLFAKPGKHGKDRVWPVGYVRQWCAARVAAAKPTEAQADGQRAGEAGE
jgi:predicted DNA-binding transcriptional regulator AlpA